MLLILQSKEERTYDRCSKSDKAAMAQLQTEKELKGYADEKQAE